MSYDWGALASNYTDYSGHCQYFASDWYRRCSFYRFPDSVCTQGHNTVENDCLAGWNYANCIYDATDNFYNSTGLLLNEFQYNEIPMAQVYQDEGELINQYYSDYGMCTQNASTQDICMKLDEYTTSMTDANLGQIEYNVCMSTIPAELDIDPYLQAPPCKFY